jgi:AP endonuclease-2
VEKRYEKILTDLEGDITCFQGSSLPFHPTASSPTDQNSGAETKITKDQIDRNMACLDNYDAFFSCYRRTAKGQGIHGTCIYTKRSAVIPLKAEEGLSSTLLPADCLSSARIGGYPTVLDTDLTLDDLKQGDLEGRTTVVDCGLFVLITVYCPNAGEKEARHIYKEKFNVMLRERVKGLIRMGRQVIVLGDINVTSIEDENNLKYPEADIYKQWLFDLIKKDGGDLVDITARYHPDRKKMFTCAFASWPSTAFDRY